MDRFAPDDALGGPMRSRGAAGERIGWLAIVCGALALRLLGLDKGLWFDEYNSLHAVFAEDVLPVLRGYETSSPLYFLLLRLWSHWGTEEWFLRLLSVLLSVVTLLLLMRWVGRYSAPASVLAGLCVATLPILLQYGQEIRPYGLLLVFTVLTFVAASRIIAAPAAWPGYLTLAASLASAVATHMVGVFLIASAGAFVICTPGMWRRIAPMKAAVAIGLPAGVFLFLSLVFHTQAIHVAAPTWWVPPFTLASVKTDVWSLLGVADLRAFVDGYVPATEVGRWIARVATFGPVAFVGVALFNLSTWRQAFPFFAAAIVYVAQVALCSMVVTPVFVARALLPALVPGLAFVGLQIAGLSQPGWRLATTAVLVLCACVFAIQWCTYRAWRPIESWKTLVPTIEEELQDGSLILCYPEYISGVLKHYLSPRWRSSVREVRQDADIAALDHDLARHAKEQPPGTLLYLFLRPGAEDPRQLEAVLQARFGMPVRTWGSRSPKVTVYRMDGGAAVGAN